MVCKREMRVPAELAAVVVGVPWSHDLGPPSACKVVPSPGKLKHRTPRTCAVKALHFLPYSPELKLAFRNPPSPVQTKCSQVKHTALLQGSFLWQQQGHSRLVPSIQ